MATIAMPRDSRDEAFFLKSAIVMALVVVTGFSTQFALGRSTFASPLRVHLHAVVFMGWVAIYVTQNVLASRGSLALHRRLGWVATGWMIAMVVLGFVVTIAMVRNGTTPFFFQPVQFMVFDPMTVVTVAALTFAAVRLRRQTDWHRRLHYCAMALVMTPAFGRLLPMPFLIPFAFEATIMCALLVISVGMIRDKRRSGAVHPAWLWGAGTILGAVLLTEALAFGPLGVPLYRAVTAGTPGAAVMPNAFPPRPAGPLRTGRAPAI
jgi:hypothetical protein